MMFYLVLYMFVVFFFFKQKTAYDRRISDWSSDLCSSDLPVLDHIASLHFLHDRAGLRIARHFDHGLVTVRIEGQAQGFDLLNAMLPAAAFQFLAGRLNADANQLHLLVLAQFIWHFRPRQTQVETGSAALRERVNSQG